MFNPVMAHEANKVKQQEIQQWAAQQRLANSVGSEQPALGRRVRRAAGTLLVTVGKWLQPRESLRDSTASHGTD